MTREELRDYVDEQRTLNNIPYHVYSALIDGIDELEQEPCEDWHDIPSGEMTLEQARQAVRELRKYVMDNHIFSKSENTVSRQAVLDIDFHKLIHTTTKPAEIIRQKIKDLPPVTPQPKTGYWIDTGSGQMCSRCGEIQYGYDSFRRFCASCGAKMIDQQEMQLCRKEN